MSGKQAKRQRKAAMQTEVESMKPIVVKFIRGAVDKLRQEYARRLKIIRQNDPEGAAELADALTPCQTCAFSRTADFTDGYDGFLGTSCLLVEAMAEGRPFVCHQPKEPGELGDYLPREFPCIGWLTLQSPTPGPFDVRELLGDETVDTLIEGSRILNPERHQMADVGATDG